MDKNPCTSDPSCPSREQWPESYDCLWSSVPHLRYEPRCGLSGDRQQGLLGGCSVFRKSGVDMSVLLTVGQREGTLGTSRYIIQMGSLFLGVFCLNVFILRDPKGRTVANCPFTRASRSSTPQTATAKGPGCSNRPRPQPGKYIELSHKTWVTLAWISTVSAVLC